MRGPKNPRDLLNKIVYFVKLFRKVSPLIYKENNKFHIYTIKTFNQKSKPLIKNTERGENGRRDECGFLCVDGHIMYMRCYLPAIIRYA